MTTTPTVMAYFDEPTNTISYLVSDESIGDTAVIDPVLDYDHKAGKVHVKSAQKILDDAKARDLTIVWVLETHPHADHLTAASYIKAKTGAKIAIGEHVNQVQRVFKALFNDPDISTNGVEFDRLLKDGETFKIGALDVTVIHTPGHTPACVSYLIGDAVFVGDTLFMPDYGTARTDFPGGDAAMLYRSIQRLMKLPPETRLFTCHDYKAPGRDRYAWETTVADQRARNVHVRDGISEDEFITMRQKRDATLSAPVLLLPSVQVNIRAGRFAKPEGNGTRYLKIPLRLADDLEAIFD